MDNITKKQRSYIMSRIKSKGTKPEIKFHRILSKLGIAHKMQPVAVGSPDAAIFTVPTTMVFINGCFWHSCPKHFKMPKSNRKFWENKITTNGLRQKDVTKALKKQGYIVKVIWECDL